jgi:hypothetical protein
MNFEITISRKSVLLMVYRWVLERREAVGSEGWVRDTNYKIQKKIAATRKVGARINVCPVVWSILRGIVVTLPLWMYKYIVMPVGVAGLFVGALWLALWGGYQELSGWSSTFDWIAALKVAGIVVGICAALYALHKPILYLLIGLLKALVYTVWGIWWVCDRLSPQLAWFGNFVFGRVPEKRVASSGTLAVVGAWFKGQYEQHCPQATVTA